MPLLTAAKDPESSHFHDGAITCNLCGGIDFVDFLPAYSRSEGLQEKLRLVKCRRCGLVTLAPTPSWDQLSKFYPRSYYAGGPSEGLLARLADSLDSVRRGKPETKRGRLLDVGCGNGDFLASMATLGIEVYGVEPSESGYAICKSRGLNVQNAFLDQTEFREEYFDVITINHVLEHVPDPSLTLRQIRRLLKPDGILIVQVPNLDSFAFRVSGAHYLHLDVPRHLSHFSKSTLVGLLKKEDFRIVRIRFPSSSMAILESLFLGSRGDRAVTTKQQVFASRSKGIFFFVEALSVPLMALLEKLQLGDSIEVFATKNA